MQGTILIMLYVNGNVLNILVSRFSLALFLTIHWMFVSHYLQIACLFRLAFSSHTLVDLQKMRCRKNWLIALDIGCLILIVFCFIVPIWISEERVSQQVFGTLWAIFYWSVALMNLIALRYIQKK